VTVIDGASNGVVATVAVGTSPRALCHNPANNKIYCANYGSRSVTVIDGATDSLITTATVGRYPKAIYYNPINNKVYCGNLGDATVTVIGGADNQVLRTVGVGWGPRAFCHNPDQNRVYVANGSGMSISVLRDSMTSVEEAPKSALRCKPLPTVVRGVLFLPRDMTETAVVSDRVPRPVLLDVTGRKVLDLHPGANDVRALAPGVYFVREAQAQAQAQAVRKVVVTR